MRRAQPLVVFAREALAGTIQNALPEPMVRVRSREAFLAEASKAGAIAFVEASLLWHAESLPDTPIVAVSENTLPEAVRLLEHYSWLAHIVTTTLLASPIAHEHVQALVDQLRNGTNPQLFGFSGVGRIALLAGSSRREERLERIREFFAKHGLAGRALATVQDISEELITNALYDAPADAGYFEHEVSRTEDVELPIERACEISYGIEGARAFVRVRDTFGALVRHRLISVLSRCSTSEVALDESRGGAGLGLWRVFSAASTIAITVAPGRMTDMVVEIAVNAGRFVPGLHAIHLFFAPDTPVSVDNMVDLNQIDHSVSLVGRASDLLNGR